MPIVRSSPARPADAGSDPAAALDDTDEPTLVQALVAGDPRAPRVLWQRFAPMVFRILRRSLGPGSDVEDLAQEVFFCVFQKARTLRDPCALKAFVISVTVLTCRHELRRRWVRRRARLFLRKPRSPELETVTRDADAREALLRFYRVLGRVKATDRAALVLRFMESLELQEVASTLGVSLATTKRRLARGWAKVTLLVERDRFLTQYRASLAVPKRR